MALVLTFLGKGGTGRTTVAIATAMQLAGQGKRVLLASQDSGPSLSQAVNRPLTSQPQEISPGLMAVQFRATDLLEQNWETLKALEANYLRTPFFKAVYGQELGVLPGLDGALALNAIREYEGSGQYDVIVYDSTGDQTTLRMMGTPEILGWYVRRFRQVFSESDLGKSLSPFLQPIAATVLNVNWSSGDWFNQPEGRQMNNLLEQGQAAIADPNRIRAYLVTTADVGAIATAKYLWGGAQMVGLTVGGVVLNQAIADPSQAQALASEFSPLTITPIPTRQDDWQPLMQALPDLTLPSQAPRPIRIDTAERKVYLFLPGFDKKQVKLTQYGPEVTVEAGDQRRNIALPPELSGRQVTGAKFQDGYLIISF